MRLEAKRFAAEPDSGSRQLQEKTGGVAPAGLFSEPPGKARERPPAHDICPAEAERVVNGAGRVAHVDTLDLAAGNVDHANGRVAIDRHLRSSSNPQVHVCADAVPTSPQLSPIATYEGDIVGRNIVEGPKYSPDYTSMATWVYTVPALAAVGLTEAAARQKGLTIDVHTNDMLEWFSRTNGSRALMRKPWRGRRSWSIGPSTAFSARILLDMPARNSSTSSDWRCITARQIRENVYAYPTFSSDIRYMLGHA